MNVRVQWYDHTCEWISKYCDENHTRSASVPIEYLRNPDRFVREHSELAWDAGYSRGVRDAESDLEPADNPYRGTPIGVPASSGRGTDA